MATIRLAGTKNILFEFRNLMMDEFIPLLEFDTTRFDSGSGFLSADSQDAILSEYIDESIRRIEPKVVDTECRKIKLPFAVKKGCSKTLDQDGIVEAKLSITDPEVQIVGATSFKTNYGGFVDLEIEIRKNARIEFYVDFYARDDDEGELNKGELRNVHCGRTKVVFAYSVTTDWETIAPVIPKNKFVGWGAPITWLPAEKTAECFHYALEQLRQVKYWVKSEGWCMTKKDGAKVMNEHIYQLFLEQDIAGMNKGVQKGQFEPGVEYLKKALKAGIPVLAGVDDDSKVVNDDMTTEHFIAIVGMGEDSVGKYFLFYDNAVPDIDIGTSSANKLYCKTSQYLIEGTGDLRNTYIRNITGKKKYIVTQVRETK